MAATIQISEARAEEAWEIADLYLAARFEAMPYLPRPHTDDEIREWFSERLRSEPEAFWVARCEGRIVGYMYLHQHEMDDLYVQTDWQRRGIGLALLSKAKALRPQRLTLSTFQRNANAQAFYEANGFRVLRRTERCNEEREPDVRYEWRGKII